MALRGINANGVRGTRCAKCDKSRSYTLPVLTWIRCALKIGCADAPEGSTSKNTDHRLGFVTGYASSTLSRGNTYFTKTEAARGVTSGLRSRLWIVRCCKTRREDGRRSLTVAITEANPTTPTTKSEESILLTGVDNYDYRSVGDNGEEDSSKCQKYGMKWGILKNRYRKRRAVGEGFEIMMRDFVVGRFWSDLYT
jgi:hypothetical protein